MKMIGKEPSTQRGIRLPDSHWEKLIDIAQEREKKSDRVVTPSDVARHAIALYLQEL